MVVVVGGTERQCRCRKARALGCTGRTELAGLGWSGVVLSRKVVGCRLGGLTGRLRQSCLSPVAPLLRGSVETESGEQEGW